VSIVIAGLLCIGAAIGHTVIGHAWVLPGLRSETLPETPFGRGPMTKTFLAVTWDVVGIAASGMGVLVIAVANQNPSSERTWVLNTVAGVFTGIAILVLWLTRRHPAALLRAPMWTLFVAIAVLCWFAR
jgi:hypothetical protein